MSKVYTRIHSLTTFQASQACRRYSTAPAAPKKAGAAPWLLGFGVLAAGAYAYLERTAPPPQEKSPLDPEQWKDSRHTMFKDADAEARNLLLQEIEQQRQEHVQQEMPMSISTGPGPSMSSSDSVLGLLWVFAVSSPMDSFSSESCRSAVVVAGPEFAGPRLQIEGYVLLAGVGERFGGFDVLGCDAGASDNNSISSESRTSHPVSSTICLMAALCRIGLRYPQQSLMIVNCARYFQNRCQSFFSAFKS